MDLFDYEIEYYDPFPYQKSIYTSDPNDIIDVLKKYGSIRVFYNYNNK